MTADSGVRIILKSDKKTDVKIAGDFNNWTPQDLKFNSDEQLYEYVIAPRAKSGEIDGAKGKYCFKFIIGDKWVVDSSYPTEFDASGNENNVVEYDYSVKDGDGEDKKDDLMEPQAPNPTPVAGLSKKTTHVDTPEAGAGTGTGLAVAEAGTTAFAGGKEERGLLNESASSDNYGSTVTSGATPASDPAAPENAESLDATPATSTGAESAAPGPAPAEPADQIVTEHNFARSTVTFISMILNVIVNFFKSLFSS